MVTSSVRAVNNQPQSSQIGLDLGYTYFGALNILGDADFHNLALVNNWDLGGTRNGTIAAPYVIQNYDFNGQDNQAAVNITGTTVAFIFKNNVVHNATAGIGLNIRHVANAVFISNEIYDTNWGTFFVDMSGALVRGNIFHDCYFRGLNIGSSYGVDIANNNFVNIQGDAIVIEGGASVRAFHNTISFSNKGISLWSGNCFIYNNTIHDVQTAIQVDLGSNNVISGNKFFEIGVEMIHLYTISNTIQWNEFVSGNHTNSEIVADLVGNTIYYNFYTGYIGAVDANGDGFADSSYNMGVAIDSRPLMHPYERGDFVVPNPPNTTEYSPLTINWNDPLDSYALNATYTLYYSFGAPLWIQVGQVSNSFQLTLDMLSLSSNTTISLKIVSVSDGGKVSVFISGSFQLAQGEVAPATSLYLSPNVPANKAVTLSWDTPLGTGTHPLLYYAVYQSVNEGLFELYNTTAALSTVVYNLSEGDNYTYYVTIVTAVGESFASNTVFYDVPDQTPPTFNIYGVGPATTTLSGSVNIEVQAFDNVGIDYIYVGIWNAAFNKTLILQTSSVNASIFLDTTQFDNGDYMVEVNVVDLSGLNAMASFQVQINNPTNTATSTGRPTNTATDTSTNTDTNLSDPLGNLGLPFDGLSVVITLFALAAIPQLARKYNKKN